MVASPIAVCQSSRTFVKVSRLSLLLTIQPLLIDQPNPVEPAPRVFPPILKHFFVVEYEVR